MDAPSIRELRAMSDADLIEGHDRAAEHVQVDVRYFLDELHRREMGRHSRTIRNLTVVIAVLTAVVTVATVLNVV